MVRVGVRSRARTRVGVRVRAGVRVGVRVRVEARVGVRLRVRIGVRNRVRVRVRNSAGRACSPAYLVASPTQAACSATSSLGTGTACRAAG